MLSALLTSLETTTWTNEWSVSINPVEATAYGHKYIPGVGLVLQMYHKLSSYGGWLCKNVAKLPIQVANLTFSFNLTVDPATLVSAQVIECDTKITDAAGYTYDGSAQFELRKNPKGWVFQVGSPWVDTNIVIPPLEPNRTYNISIKSVINYDTHTIKIVSLTVTPSGGLGVVYTVTTPLVLTAAQIGWGISEIVTQLQQCNNGVPGGYALIFTDVTYALSQ